MPWPEISSPSPNHAVTPPHERIGVCFHHTVIPFGETLALMQTTASRVSYHVVISTDGTRARLVADHHVAWHAGVSSFKGRNAANAFLLGIAFAGDTRKDPLTASQIASALEWMGPRWSKYRWTLEWITDHRQVAPNRKDDLKPDEWARLLQAIRSHFV